MVNGELLMVRKIRKVLKIYLIVVGILAHLGLLWMGLKGPLIFDRWLRVSQPPQKADAIVCLCGGIVGNNLPTQRGMQRIYTAVQLYADGWAPKVIFTGRGGGSLSEAEVYAEAACWLGLPEKAVVVEPFSESTAEHAENVLKLKEISIRKDTPLLIVTSAVHSRRASMCFRKDGFTRFRMVTGYRARFEDVKDKVSAVDTVGAEDRVHAVSAEPDKTGREKRVEMNRNLRESQVKEYKPSQKKYDDFFFRMYQKSSSFWMALREYAAIAWYWVKGEV